MLDSISLLRSIDKMLMRALAANAPFTIVNFPGHHGFEVVDDTASARETIARTLDFMRSALSAPLQREISAAVQPAAAWAALQAENWIEAIPLLEKLAQNHSTDSEVYRQLGEAYLAAKRYQDALAPFQKALDLGSINRGLISLSAAICAAHTGSNDEALRWLAQVPPFPAMMKRVRENAAFDAIRGDPRFPAAAK